jgi:N-acetylneuraminate synthase
MDRISQRDKTLFGNLFVLETANNHNGNIEKAFKIIETYGQICRQNGVKAAIKLQFRKMDSFVHPDYQGTDRGDEKALNYIKKTEKKELTKDQYRRLVDKIRDAGCIPMSTPFDEDSVDICVEYDLPIIKIASSDVNDWPLIEKIASTRKPVIASSGGADEKALDDLVTFFSRRDIPLCLNHCVSLYPSEDHQLHLDQIDYLKNRYPANVIGFSTHEYHDWSNSMMISYGKGVRCWERHVDIDWPEEISPVYNSKPREIDEWFKAFHKAREMCGGIKTERRQIPPAETKYLDALVRGVYAKHDVPEGTTLNSKNLGDHFYLAIPLLKGQLSCRELFNGELLRKSVMKDAPLMIDDVNGVYAEDESLKEEIRARGL